MIQELKIQNFKQFQNITIHFNNDLNILVGDNGEGKSTILEALNLVLTKKLNDKYFEKELSPFLFNQEVSEKYSEALFNGEHIEPPEIIIEAYFSYDPSPEIYEGNINTKGEKASGIQLRVFLDLDTYASEYAEFVTKQFHLVKDSFLIPTEFYKVEWISFHGTDLNHNNQIVKTSYIDTTPGSYNKPDSYIQNFINRTMEGKSIATLDYIYRKMRDEFIKQEDIANINKILTEESKDITDKELTLGMNLSSSMSWQRNLTSYLRSIPFEQIGQGEKNKIKMMLALGAKELQSVVLIEEPENHLSHTQMQKLINQITKKCEGKQIIITTHSTFVLNKLGLDKLILLSNQKEAKISALPKETYNYFKRLSGYDTLRLLLAQKTILVEGPSDDLIVQKAFLEKNSKSHQDSGFEVISINGLSFKHFLAIAKPLIKEVRVVTDNDGNYEEHIKKRYIEYESDKNISIFSSTQNSLNSLEENLVDVNSLESLNKVLDRKAKTKDEILDYMSKDQNKTTVAIKIFEAPIGSIKFPKYIEDAVTLE